MEEIGMRIPEAVPPTGHSAEAGGGSVGKAVMLASDAGSGVYRGLGVGREVVPVAPATVVPTAPPPGGSREREAWGTRINRGDEFDAVRLRLADIPGKAIVRTGSRSGRMSVAITGPESLKEKIRLYVSQGTLNVVGPAGGGGGGTVFASQDGVTVVSGTVSGGMSIVGGRVYVDGAEVPVGGGGAPVGRVEVVVEVPWATPVEIKDGVAGRYEVDDTQGALIVDLHGSGGVIAGRVGPAQVTIRGAAEVLIQSVTGQALEGRITGAGEMTVREGQVDQVKFKVTGSANAIYGGLAVHADLSVTGTGEIRVNEVTGRVRESRTGMGEISVHRRPQGDPNAFWR